MNKLTEQDGQSLNIIDENIAALQTIFPEAFTEEKVDFGVLRQLLGDAVDDGEEKYGLTWFGKKQARQIALTPSLGTLRPCPEESVDWETTQNLFIEGDNLEVLKLLQKSYAGKVKMIYIDPPYNTGKEFIYPDKFQDNLDTYLRYTGQKDDEGMIFSSNTETSGRYHTNWLNMMYPRLKLAKNLLSSDGIIFISIDDNELANLKQILDDIFGSENFKGCISRVTGTPTGGGNDAIVNEIDHIFVYSKSSQGIIKGLPFNEDDAKIYDKEDALGRYLIRPLRRTGGEDRREDRPTMYYPLKAPDGELIYPIAPAGYESRWICGKEKYHELVRDSRIEWIKTEKDGQEIWQVYQKFYLDGRSKQPSNLWKGIEGNKKATRDLKKLFGGNKVFDFPKPIELVRRMIHLTCTNDSVVLDFFAGAATTGHAVYLENYENNLNLRFINIQLPEGVDSKTDAAKLGFSNISEIAKQRLRLAIEQIRKLSPPPSSDLGFKVFKLDSSNIRAWNPDSSNLEQTLLDHKEHLVPGRSEQDVLYELLLKRGVELTVPIEERIIAGKTVYSIGYGALFACLNETIRRENVEELAHGILAWHKELSPASDTQIIFRDSAFADDIAKTNTAAILEQNGLSHVRSL